MKDNSKRVWLDTTTLAVVDKPRQVVDSLVGNGHICVIANSVLDVEAFQRGLGWFEGHLRYKRVIIEMWLTGDQMVSKEFFWTSCDMTTPASSCLAEAVKPLPNGQNIIELNALMTKYGIPKGKWTAKPWKPPHPLSAELRSLLGLNSGATRTEVLSACKKKDLMGEYDKYNIAYNASLAYQHNCGMMLNCDGTISEI